MYLNMALCTGYIAQSTEAKRTRTRLVVDVSEQVIGNRLTCCVLCHIKSGV